MAKQILKIARDFEPLFGEPRFARRAAKSMDGAVRRPRNGFQKIGTSGFGVFIQFRSNLFYQKFVNFTSASAAAAIPFPLKPLFLAAAARVYPAPSFALVRGFRPPAGRAGSPF